MLYQLIYGSSAAGLYDADTYRKIAGDATNFNKSVGISGLLLLYNETILQVLEGPKDVVEALFEKIKSDRRHKNAIKLSGEVIEARQFKDWAMGFEAVKNTDEPEFLFQIRSATLDQKLPEYVCERTKVLISTFRQSSGLDPLY